MPIFHFNVHDGTSIPDPDGHELPDVKAAQRYAVTYAADMLRDYATDFWSGQEWSMEVTDHRGMILFSLTFFGSYAPTMADFRQSPGT